MKTKPINSPPEPEQLEISVFGPGRGECALVHLGSGDWICIDSCLDRETGRPVALRYLDDIGVDPAQALRLVIVTHWHQDHMRGAAEVFEQAKNAEFVCSGALRSDEFWTAIAASEAERNHEQTLSEFARVFSILETRSPDGARPGTAAPIWAQDGLILWERAGSDTAVPVHIRSVSPSPGARRLGMKEIGAFLPRVKETKRRAVPLDPNQQSVAVWVQVGNTQALFGADLENSSDVHIGWQAVLRSPRLPSGQADILKVPHHGSKNAYCRDLWEAKLISPATALITPFASASRPVPNEADCARIALHTDRAFLTADPRGSKVKSGDRLVERRIRTTPRRIRQVVGKTGHIRVRRQVLTGGEVEIELFQGALQLTEYIVRSRS
ncbi:MAG: hypothetical protein DCC71_20735 [Proteobacteria bacterium]|nr:MAG: hypothetical protein DCC71_20735 [Pseudomonadota bacterium]